MRHWTLPFALALGFCVHAQDVVVYGRVREYEAMRPVQGAVLALSCDGVQVLKVQCDSTGYYRLSLDVGRVWRICYQASDRVAKLTEFDLRTTPKYDGGYGMNVDIRLFLDEPGKDFTWLEEPIAISRYDSATTNLKWDMDYTAPRLARMRELMPDRYDLTATDSISKPAPEK